MPRPLLMAGGSRRLRFKVDLPNYGVFDEKRVFAPGPMPGPVNFRGVRIGIPICEDIWGPEPAECIAETGGEILLVPNGSPYRRGVVDQRLSVAVGRVKETGLPLIYLNQVGGQDELVFEGASFVLNGDGSLAAQLPAFAEAIVTTRWTRKPDGWHCAPGEIAPLDPQDRSDYTACMLGLRDYVGKNGFPGVVLGLSGGIDSALVRRDRRRCARRRSGARGDAALQIHLAGIARRCRRGRRRARHPLRHRADRKRGAGPRKDARAGVRRTASATLRRKICRRARAAPS